MRSWLLWLAVLCGCDGALGANGTGGGAGGGSGSVGGGAGQTTSGIPCDVATIVLTRCAACHGQPPSGGAPIALLSRADFLAASAVNAAQTHGERSVLRMRDAVNPMPPGAQVASSEIDVVAAWVTAGMPAGTCDSLDAGFVDPTPTCLSGVFEPTPVAGDAHGGPGMAPGWACRACHAGQDFMGQNPGGLLDRADQVNQFMGTVFRAPHEKDLCAPRLGLTGQVQILDLNGTVRARLPFGADGNFSGNVPTGMPSPYRARVVTSGGERMMQTGQTNGDCNTCHTVAGREGAPGRIYLP